MMMAYRWLRTLTGFVLAHADYLLSCAQQVRRIIISVDDSYPSFRYLRVPTTLHRPVKACL